MTNRLFASSGLARSHTNVPVRETANPVLTECGKSTCGLEILRDRGGDAANLERPGIELHGHEVTEIAVNEIPGLNKLNLASDRDPEPPALTVREQQLDVRIAATLGHRERQGAPGQSMRPAMLELSAGPGAVNGTGSAPPAAATSMSPCLPEGAKTIRPASVQVAPAHSPHASAILRGSACPSVRMRHKWPAAKNASDAPSGEKNGLAPPTVPGSSRSCAPAESSDRMKMRRVPPGPDSAAYASHCPSRETAKVLRTRLSGIGAANRTGGGRHGGRLGASRAATRGRERQLRALLSLVTDLEAARQHLA